MSWDVMFCMHIAHAPPLSGFGHDPVWGKVPGIPSCFPGSASSRHRSRPLESVFVPFTPPPGSPERRESPNSSNVHPAGDARCKAHALPSASSIAACTGPPSPPRARPRAARSPGRKPGAVLEASACDRRSKPGLPDFTRALRVSICPAAARRRSAARRLIDPSALATHAPRIRQVVRKELRMAKRNPRKPRTILYGRLPSGTPRVTTPQRAQRHAWPRFALPASGRSNTWRATGTPAKADHRQRRPATPAEHRMLLHLVRARIRHSIWPSLTTRLATRSCREGSGPTLRRRLLQAVARRIASSNCSDPDGAPTPRSGHEATRSPTQDAQFLTGTLGPGYPQRKRSEPHRKLDSFFDSDVNPPGQLRHVLS